MNLSFSAILRLSYVDLLGGPNNASLPIVLFIYQVGFQRWDIGYAAAASEMLFCIILIAAMTQFFASRGREKA